jgi:radical SAM superfamily enzyme YgiQ (UPF0313 family)
MTETVQPDPTVPSHVERPIRKVLLAVPPTGLYIREDRCQTPIKHMPSITLRPPIDLLYAAAGFEMGGATCTLVDYPAENQDLAGFLDDIRQQQPDLVLLSITTPGFDDDMAVAAHIKEVAPATVVAAKGAHFNVLDRQAFERYPALDLAFRGEYELACRDLAAGRPWSDIEGLTYRTAAGEMVRTADRPFLEDLDTLPFPARHLAHNALYVRPDTGEMQTTLVTNRGCPFSCIYCLANQVAGRKNRMRSPGNILAEIRECVERYGIRNFLFRSDLFTANRVWLLELCRLIQESGLKIAWSCNSRVDTIDRELLQAMKAAGCWIIAFGVESGSQEMLDRINKKTDLSKARQALAWTRQAGLLSSIYFLIGLPWETEETLAANERFAREINPDVLEIFYVYPFPGTVLHAQAVELGLLCPDQIPQQAYDAPCMDGLHLTREQLTAARNRILSRFYLRPRIIARTLWRARSLRELGNYLWYGLRQIKEFL